MPVPPRSVTTTATTATAMTAFRRLLALRPRSFPTSGSRSLTRHANGSTSHTYANGRPQLPFLSSPLGAHRAHRGPLQFRYLTTERKRWLAHEVVQGLKYTGYIWAIVAFSVIAWWSVQQESLERRYPTPHEWRFITRLRFRLASWAPERSDLPQPEWNQAAAYAKNVLNRLEDPSIDGAGLQDLTEGGMWIDGVGKSGYDVTATSEPWTRGYYETLMLCAKAAEHLDDCVLDKSRNIVFPADQVIGPSNPNPRPIPAGSPAAPQETDCVPVFDAPETFYMRVMTTRGFTSKQKLDAALQYANWLDFKSLPEAAERMYEWALTLATDNLAPADIPYDAKTLVLKSAPPQPPSANVLNTLTAFAVSKARSNDVSSALPILISILRARRSLPSSPTLVAESPAAKQPESHDGGSAWSVENIIGLAKRIALPPAYPPPPSDGNAPPARDARGLCEEAGLNLYIGEIMYTTNSRAREDGLAWTREAVDVAEEQLHKLQSAAVTGPPVQTCRECLDTGLGNWAKMVGRLAREEEERNAAAKESAARSSSGWLGGLWGGSSRPADAGRWAAEEAVIRERTRRAEDLVEGLEAPPASLLSLLSA